MHMCVCVSLCIFLSVCLLLYSLSAVACMLLLLYVFECILYASVCLYLHQTLEVYKFVLLVRFCCYSVLIFCFTFVPFVVAFSRCSAAAQSHRSALWCQSDVQALFRSFSASTLIEGIPITSALKNLNESQEQASSDCAWNLGISRSPLGRNMATISQSTQS